MKEKMTDEKMDGMLKKLFDSEVPEEMQFHEHISDEMKVTVKKKELINHSVFIKSGLAVAAATVLAFPLYHLITSPEKNTDFIMSDRSADPEFKKCLDEFDKEVSEYTFECIKLESSDYYRHYSEAPYICEGESEGTGMFIYLGLIPYEKYETSGAELYVRTVNEGRRKVYTRQAYILWHDENGNETAVIRSKEILSDEEAEEIMATDVFKGEKNASVAVNTLVSRFQLRGNPVKYEGVTVREAIDNDAEYVCNTDGISVYIGNDGEKKPLSLYEFFYSTDTDLFRKGDIPETDMNIRCGKNETSYYTVFAYDCTKKLPFRVKSIETEELWEGRKTR